MDRIAVKLGVWSAISVAVLVLLIDVGMIASEMLYPLTSITSIDAYATSFTSWQMLPFVPSFVLAPTFIVFMLCLYYYASEDAKILGQLSLIFATICGAILSLHYYIQLTIVQQGLLNNQTNGLWMLAAPNPHSLFWSLAALGYGFMGFALLSAASLFKGQYQRIIQVLFIANGFLGTAFLVGNVLGIFIVDIFVSFAWGILFPIAMLLVAKNFKTNSS